MVINFLYCIDFPKKSDNVEKPDQIRGWLICSNRIINIGIPETLKDNYRLEYGSPRPDVAKFFRGFPGNDECGYIISSNNEPFNLQQNFFLDVEVDIFRGKTKKLRIALDLSATSIQDIEVEDDEKSTLAKTNKIEEKFVNGLKKHPWITVRMDITNKCNLHCIMCHYKEEEIYSKPAKNIT